MSGSSSDGPENQVSQRDEKEKSGVLPPTSSEGAAELSDVAEDAGNDSQNASSGLPFTKARSIALVATLTGASFLNVSHSPGQGDISISLRAVADAE